MPLSIFSVPSPSNWKYLCIAEALPEGAHLDTVEIDDEMEDFIRSRFGRSPHGHKITLHIGDFSRIAPSLQPGYDLAYMDANKRTYTETFALVRSLVRPGGFILADNTLWDGKVTDTTRHHDPQTLGIAEFNDTIAADPSLEKVILPLRDGLTLIRIKT